MALFSLSSFGIEPGQTLAAARPQVAHALSKITGYGPEQPLTAEELGRTFLFSDVFLHNNREAMAGAAQTVAGNGNKSSCLGATNQTASLHQHTLKDWRPREPKTVSGGKAPSVEEGAAPGESARPQPGQYADHQDYIEAFLEYQDGNMAELKALYPKAWLRPCSQWRLFYGTRQLTPEQAMESGIPPKDGDNFDILAHQTEGTRTLSGEVLDPRNRSHRTGMRGGSRTGVAASHCGADGGYVYVLEPRGGAISLMDALGDRESRYCASELEACFGSCQPPERIVGWHRVGAYSDGHESYRLGRFEPNPKYRSLDD